jgi:hypothetical protein
MFLTSHPKISPLPQTAKPIGLGLAVSLRVAGTHLETTDDVGRNFGAALGRANGDVAAAEAATTQRSLFLQGTTQPGDLPWTRKF